MKNEYIRSSTTEKLLGIIFNNKFNFEDHVAYLCKRTSRKLHVLAHIANYMDLPQRRKIMKAFTCSQFGFCPLIWIFRGRKLNNHIKNLHELALRIVYTDCKSHFKDLLKKDTSISIHQKNLQILATEIYKTKNGLNPKIMDEFFIFDTTPIT